MEFEITSVSGSGNMGSMVFNDGPTSSHNYKVNVSNGRTGNIA